jgi:RNA polymerase sigma-70 factor (ECF subfamily)
MSIEDIYDQHAEKVYRFFYIHCFNQSVAEDLTSQTFLNFVEKMHDPGTAIADHKKYLYGVMRNVWTAHLRKKYQQKEVTLETVDDFEDLVTEEVENYSHMSIEERAMSFINLLPQKQRAVLALRLIQKRSLKEIASELNKDINYVKTTQKRGIKRLKELLDKPELAYLLEEES